MSRKRSKKKDQSTDLVEALVRNGHAIAEGPKRKTWTKHDIKTIKPLTTSQEDMFHAFFAGKNVCAHGTAGTGKTYIALYLALNEMTRAEANIKKIIIVRSAVPTREMGFMPGTLEEKMALYETPYVDMFADLLRRRNSYRDMKDAGLVEFCVTSYIRGLTWDDAVVVVDETQNMTFHEINSIMTRLGQNSRIIMVGDTAQSDLKGKRVEQTGMDRLLEVANRMESFDVVHFTKHDIVRGDVVKSWIVACEEA